MELMTYFAAQANFNLTLIIGITRIVAAHMTHHIGCFEGQK